MPSNKDLTQQAEELAEKLGKEVETEGLKNAELVELVAKLRKEVEAEEAPAAEVEAEEAPAAEVEAEEAPAFHVAEGKAITSKRGILADGDEIKATDLAGGEKALEAFIKSKHVVKG